MPVAKKPSGNPSNEAIIDGQLRINNNGYGGADRKEREICAPSNAIGQMRTYEQTNE